MVQCIPGPFKIPSGTGFKVLELESYVGKLLSRENIKEKVNSSIQQSISSPTPQPILLIAEWGMGKSSIYEVIIKKMYDEKKIFPLYVTAATIFKYLKSIIKGDIFPDTKEDAYQFMAALLLAVSDQYGEKLQEPPLASKYRRAQDYVREYMNYLHKLIDKEGIDTILFFIDEFEDINQYYRDFIQGTSLEIRELASEIIRTSLNGIVHIANGNVREILNNKYKHALILSLTPTVWYTISKDKSFQEIIGRYRAGRVNIVEIPPLPAIERIKFIKGVIKYMFDTMEDITIKVFKPPSLLNSLIQSTLGNMAYIQSALARILISRINKQTTCPQDKTEPIDYRVFYDILVKSLEVEIYGKSVPLILRSTNEKIISILKEVPPPPNLNKEILIEVYKYLITNIIIDLKEASNNIGVENINEYINEINFQFKHGPLSSIIKLENTIYPVKAYILNEDVDIDKVIEKYSEEIKEALRYLELPIEEKVKFVRSIVNNMIYILPNGNPGIINLPEGEKGITLLQELSDIPIEEDTTISLINVIKEIIKDLGGQEEVEELLLLSPKLYKFLYLTAELLYLEFIEDREKRLELWRKSLERSEDNTKALLYGVIPLLAMKNIFISAKSFELFLGDINIKGILAPNTTVIYQNKEFLMNMIIIVSRVHLTREHISKISKVINDVPGKYGIHPHVVLVIHRGGKELLEETLKPRLAKQLIKLVDTDLRYTIYDIQLTSFGRLLMEDLTDTFQTLIIITNYMYDASRRKSHRREDLVRKITELLSPSMRSIINVSSFLNVLDDIGDTIKITPEIIIKALRSKPVTIIEDPQTHKKINDIPIEINSIKDLFNFIRYFLVYPDDKAKPIEVYEYVIRTIFNYHPFKGEASDIRSKIGILNPDIESENEFMKYTIIALINHLLKAENEIPRNIEAFKDIIIEIDKLSPIEESLWLLLNNLLREYNSSISLDNVYTTLVDKYFVVTAGEHTKKGIFDLLNYRGLINIKGTTKSKKSLKTNIEILLDKEVYGLMNFLKESLQKLYSDNSYLIKRYGYMIVFSKNKMKIRHIEYLLNPATGIIAKYLDLAYKSLYYNQYGTRRYIKVIQDLLNLYKNYYYNLLKEVHKLFCDAQRILSEINDEVDKLTRGIRDRLQEIIGGKAIVELDLLELKELNDAIKRVNDIQTQEITYDVLESIAKEIFEKRGINNEDYKAFHFKNSSYYYNYKLYKLIKDEHIMNFLWYDNNKKKFDKKETIKMLIESLKNAIEELRKYDDKLSEIRKLRNDMKKLSNDSMILQKVINKIDIPSILLATSNYMSGKIVCKSSKELINLANDIIKSLEHYIQDLREIKQVINEITNTEVYINRTINELGNSIQLLTNLIRKMKDKKLLTDQYDIEVRIKDIIEEKDHITQRFNELTTRPINMLDITSSSIVPKQIFNQIKTELNNIKTELNELNEKTNNLVERIQKIVVDNINSFKEATEIIYKIIKLLKSKVKTFNFETLEKLSNYEDTLDSIKKRINTVLSDIQDQKHWKILENIDKDISYIVDIREQITKIMNGLENIICDSNVLTRDEYKVLLTYIKIKTNENRSFKLREISKKIGDDLGLDHQNVKNTLLSLIDKEFIEVYL